MKDDIGHAEDTLTVAEALLDRSTDGTRGLWSRAAALLGRHALEDAIARVWAVDAPGLGSCSMRAQLLCLNSYLADDRLAEEAAHAYARLSWACHQHPYDLAPTAVELRNWLQTVREITRSVHGALEQ